MEDRGAPCCCGNVSSSSSLGHTQVLSSLRESEGQDHNVQTSCRVSSSSDPQEARTWIKEGSQLPFGMCLESGEDVLGRHCVHRSQPQYPATGGLTWVRRHTSWLRHMAGSTLRVSFQTQKAQNAGSAPLFNLPFPFHLVVKGTADFHSLQMKQNFQHFRRALHDLHWISE